MVFNIMNVPRVRASSRSKHEPLFDRLRIVFFERAARTPALRVPASTAYPTNPLPPVIRTSGEDDIVEILYRDLNEQDNSSESCEAQKLAKLVLKYLQQCRKSREDVYLISQLDYMLRPRAER